VNLLEHKMTPVNTRNHSVFLPGSYDCLKSYASAILLFTLPVGGGGGIKNHEIHNIYVNSISADFLQEYGLV
jgi:hypothetical protein